MDGSAKQLLEPVADVLRPKARRASGAFRRKPPARRLVSEEPRHGATDPPGVSGLEKNGGVPRDPPVRGGIRKGRGEPRGEGLERGEPEPFTGMVGPQEDVPAR